VALTGVLLSSGSMWARSAGCHATLSVADARELAAVTPNARAFHDNLGAVLTTRVVRSNGNGSVAIGVTAKEPKRGPTQVGVYTVNLHTGRVTDDDQEPAGDSETEKIVDRLMARHCGGR
jgi:hypothetical protein